MGVIYQVTSSCDPDSIRIIFLWSKIDHYSRIRDRAVLGNVGNFGRGHDEDAVGAFFSCFIVALRDVAKFFTKGGAPRVPRDGVAGELVVARNRFARDWMDYGRTEMFDVIIVYIVDVVLRL